MMETQIAPKSLKKGDTIAIISTARKISKEELQAAINIIEALGYKYKLGKNLFKIDHQFAGTPQQRVSDLHDMYLDKDVDAILCARGGYGTVQLLPLIDNNIINQNPKWLIGYSDVTVLHSFINVNSKMQSIHASMPINFKDYTIKSKSITSLFGLLEGEKNNYSIAPSKYNVKGEAEGEIVGGNLSIIYSLRGTPADIETKDKILFIEDLDEYLYHIDRIMMNLKVGEKLSQLKGLVVGGMSDMHDNDTAFGRSAKQIILDAVKEYNYPVLFDFPAGHITENYALPLGRKVKISVQKSEASLYYL